MTRSLVLCVLLGLLGLLVPVAADAAPSKPRPRCSQKPKPSSKKCRRLPVSRPGIAAPVGIAMSREAALAVLPVAPGAVAAPAVAPPVAAPVAPARLGVVAREFSLLLSRTTLPAGAAIVELQNRGEDAHNMRLERVGSAFGLDVPLAESGEVTRASGTLAAGDYRVFCALEGHEQAGMRARLTVGER